MLSPGVLHGPKPGLLEKLLQEPLFLLTTQQEMAPMPGGATCRKDEPCTALESFGWIWPGGTIHEDNIKSSNSIRVMTYGSPETVGAGQAGDLFNPPLSLIFTAGEAQVNQRKPGCACFAVTMPLHSRKEAPGCYIHATHLEAQPAPQKAEFGLAGKPWVAS